MPIFVAGWAASEPELTWSQDTQALLRLGGVLAADDYMLRLQVGALVAPPLHAAQRIGVVIDGHRYATIATLRPETLERQLAFATQQTQKLTVLFELPDAISPAAIGLSPDERLLGLRLHRIALDRLARGAAAADGGLCADWRADWLAAEADPEDIPDWTLAVLAHATPAPVLEVSASGPAPFGLSLGDSDLVVHPVVVAGPGGGPGGEADGDSDWRALLVVPPELLAQVAQTDGMAGGMTASGVIPIWLYSADPTGQLDLHSRRPGPVVTMTF